MRLSKYTTEVRFICESYAGLPESVGADSVDSVISQVWDKIFTTKTPFFDEDYRSVLCQKIIKHYYFREIGFETVGLWKTFMNMKLEEIMPYYNQLYQSQLIKFDPLKDVDYERTFTRKQDGTANTEGTSSSTGSNKTESSTYDDFSGDTNSKDAYSDTPQGGLDGVESGEYLTNARIVNATDMHHNQNTYHSDDTRKDDTSTKTDTTTNTTEDYLEKITGKHGSENYSDMLNKFRGTLLNIDMDVIAEFKELFMGLW